ncbi:sigma-54-dependent Fis family transcriptional regulator [Candidatus Poribacteria bacterium]|nr:sigma-54-dependent Fis family transcriptional regulator [Candidatus Poribacteria bacterium]
MKVPLASMQAKILIVDDIPANLNMLSDTLEPEGYDILAAPSGEVALQLVSRNLPDLILLDVMMPKGIDGFETCRQLKQEPTTAEIPVIFVTAKDETESLVEGFRVGGVDYIAKPFEKEEVLARVGTHLKISQLTKELMAKNRKLQLEIAKRRQAEDALELADGQLSMISDLEAERWGLRGGFVGKSPTIQKILADIRRLHRTGNTNVLIMGESGTGKELIARAIHFGGPRAKGPFIPVNCTAIPKELGESSFFGHARGAFTGAHADKKGYFELASGGTLFLDEIGDMPLDLQAKLLRVLEDGNVMPVGGISEKRVDVRVLAATNADIQKKMKVDAFRPDLYYRLAGFTVTVPPLRERPEDIPLLVSHFLKLFAAEMGMEKPAFSPDALSMLQSYDFPGNIRELKNIIEHALIQNGGGVIQPEHLPFAHTNSLPAVSPAQPDRERTTLEVPLNLEKAEAALIEYALERAKGNIAVAARLVGTSRPKIYRHLMKKSH